jgi:hypothetical protein
MNSPNITINPNLNNDLSIGIGASTPAADKK